MILRHALPRMIERGVPNTLDADAYSGNTQQTATAATVSIVDGSRVVLAAVAAGSLGPPATYALLAAATSSESLSDRWLEVWTLTIGGSTYVLRRPAYLVRHVLYSTLVDQDLIDLYPELGTTELRGTTITSFAAYRQKALEYIERQLIKKGRRPELVFDAFALRDAEENLTLHWIFRDFANELGDGRWERLAAEHEAKWRAEYDAVQFRYDADQSGGIKTSGTETTSSTIYTTSGTPGGMRRTYSSRP